MIPDDLRHFKSPDAFQLFDEVTVGKVLGAGFAVLLILERMGWL